MLLNLKWRGVLVNEFRVLRSACSWRFAAGGRAVTGEGGAAGSAAEAGAAAGQAGAAAGQAGALGP
jgi:hypothetical protein